MKEYLLLRNNKQTGPYSLDDLKQMGLKAFDLIWIDKKSCGWRYPSEINELISLVPVTENTEINNVHTANQKVVSIVNNSSLSKTGSDNYEYNNQTLVDIADHSANHVIALKPTVNNTRIRTIKSHASRSIVQVQVRSEDSTPANASASIDKKQESFNAGHSISAEHNNILESLNYNSNPQLESITQNAGALQLKQPYISDNKLEMAVLIIGAISLLAIVFLLVTSPY